MSNDLEKKDIDRLTVSYDADGENIKLNMNIVQDYIVNGGGKISLQEYKFFTELCKVRRLNPFIKEAYLIKFGEQPAQMVVGKDAILKRAIKNKSFNGKEHGIIVINQEGEVKERKGTFKLPNETLVGGWAKVYRKDWEYPTYVSVAFDEVAQSKKDGGLNANWANKGATMVEKVAVVRALRETFVEDLGGMIEESEQWQAEELSRVVKEEVITQEEPMLGLNDL